MADITLCLDKKCPKREKCYRYNASPSKWQSYFSETPRRGKTCEEFWEVKLTESTAFENGTNEDLTNLSMTMIAETYSALKPIFEKYYKLGFMACEIDYIMPQAIRRLTALKRMGILK